MIEPDVTDVNGVGAIGGLGLEAAAGAIPLTGTNDPLTGGMSPETLTVPTLGAENEAATVWPLDSVGSGPSLDEDDGPVEESPSSVDQLMGVVANGQGEPSISGLMGEAVENVHSSLQELAAGPDLREKLREENGGSEATQDAAPDWLTGNFGDLPLTLNTEQSDIQEQAGNEYRTASAEFPQEEVNLRTEWIGEVYDWSVQGEGVEQPSPFNVRDALGDSQRFQAEGIFNLGSNIRYLQGQIEDGRKGINTANWGSGSVREGLPDDRFLVKGYTEVDKVDFQPGKYYRFEVSGDDGYQIWVKNLDTEEWDWVTPENKWQTTNGQERTDKFLYKVPDAPSEKGYYVGFFYYENRGEANFGLNWTETEPTKLTTLVGDSSSGTVEWLRKITLNSDRDNGINANFGDGSPGEGLPSDRFTIGTYTETSLQAGQDYKFTAKADDNFLLFISSDGRTWTELASLTNDNKWPQAYGEKYYYFTPSSDGQHFVWAYMYENTGDAYLDISWEQTKSDFNVIKSSKGASLLGRNDRDFVQIVDLSQGASLKLRTGQQTKDGDNGDDSFERQSIEDAWEGFSKENPNAFSISNGAFFPFGRTNFLAGSARLAYPLKIGKTVFEGYGKNEFPEDKRKFEIWNDEVKITEFDNEIDSIIKSEAPQVIVGLKESAEKPGKDDPEVGRMFVGVRDSDGDGKNETALLLNSEGRTQADAAQILEDFGARASEVMMLDGSESSQMIAGGEKYVESIDVFPGRIERPRNIPQTIGVVSGS